MGFFLMFIIFSPIFGNKYLNNNYSFSDISAIKMLFWHTIIYQSAFVYEVLWHNVKYIEISKF